MAEKYSKLNDLIESKILESRRIFICAAVDSNSSYEIIKKIWYLELTAPGKPITFIINSPGGSVDAGFAIWDQIKMISSPITTLVTGLAASMGSVLSLCASPGRCFATPNARIMIHQPLLGGVVQGQATDLDIHAKEILKTYNMLVQVYVDKTGKPKEEIERAIDRDTWMSAAEAEKFGLIDKIIYSNKDLES